MKIEKYFRTTIFQQSTHELLYTDICRKQGKKLHFSEFLQFDVMFLRFPFDITMTLMLMANVLLKYSLRNFKINLFANNICKK